MATEIVSITPIETCTAEVGLLVMDFIMLDKLIERGNMFEAYELHTKVTEEMEKLDTGTLNAAIAFYEKTVGDTLEKYYDNI